MGETLAGWGGNPRDTHRRTELFYMPQQITFDSPSVFKHHNLLILQKGVISLVLRETIKSNLNKTAHPSSCIPPLSLINFYDCWSPLHLSLSAFCGVYEVMFHQGKICQQSKAIRSQLKRALLADWMARPISRHGGLSGGLARGPARLAG